MPGDVPTRGTAEIAPNASFCKYAVTFRLFHFRVGHIYAHQRCSSRLYCFDGVLSQRRLMLSVHTIGSMVDRETAKENHETVEKIEAVGGR